MARHAPILKIPPADLAKLERWSKSRTISKQLIERSKIILACGSGRMVKEIAVQLETYPNKIIEWRKRYGEMGLQGLQDRPRSGKPSPNPGIKEKLLKTISSPVPKGYGRWDAPLLSEKLNCSKDVIWNLLKKEGISLQRQRSWCISTDKDFAAKAADIIGLYLDPPTKAIVLCADEKPSIQALERKTGYLQTEDGKTMRGYKSTYKRHGTLNLFAALNVATGQISSRVTEYKKREDFISFMDEIVKEYEGMELHVILDNYCTHKKNEDWLLKNPNVQFHFTPTSASWLNQVEIWFGIFSRKSLHGASFASTEHLKEHIEAYIDAYGKNSKPFKWRKREVRGSQLKDNIVNLNN